MTPVVVSNMASVTYEEEKNYLKFLADDVVEMRNEIFREPL
jgi:hypothetical protein